MCSNNCTEEYGNNVMFICNNVEKIFYRNIENYRKISSWLITRAYLVLDSFYQQFLIQKLAAAIMQELCQLSSFTIVTGITIAAGSFQNLCVERLIWKERYARISTVHCSLYT